MAMGSLLLAPAAATNQPTPRPRPSKQTTIEAGAFAARPLPLARYTGAVGDGHRARRTHPARMARDPDQARAAANSGRTQMDVRILIPAPGPQVKRNPVWNVPPAIRASNPWPPRVRSRPAPPKLPPSRSETPWPQAPAPCSPRHHAVLGPGAAAGPQWRCPGPPVYIDIRPYRRHIGVRRGWCMHIPGLARGRPHNGRLWAVQSTASAVHAGPAAASQPVPLKTQHPV